MGHQIAFEGLFDLSGERPRFTLRLNKLQERKIAVVEPLLSGIVLGLIPVTLIGLFVAAYMQYRRGDQLGG
jgi:cytochrome b6-f complex subunit 5